MGTDDGAEPPTPLGSDMSEAAYRLNKQSRDRNRIHLNEISEAVFASHALRPVDEILAELIAKSDILSYKPDVQALNAAAYAISRGRRFAFV